MLEKAKCIICARYIWFNVSSKRNIFLKNKIFHICVYAKIKMDYNVIKLNFKGLIVNQIAFSTVIIKGMGVVRCKYY